MSQSEHSPVVVGLMYPTDWETRPREQLDADLTALTAIDPRIEVVHARYLDTSELRGRRGADPTADFRSEAPELTARADARPSLALRSSWPWTCPSMLPGSRRSCGGSRGWALGSASWPPPGWPMPGSG